MMFLAMSLRNKHEWSQDIKDRNKRIIQTRMHGIQDPGKVEEKIPDGQEVPDKNEKRKTRKIRSSVTIVLGRRNLKRESSLFF